MSVLEDRAETSASARAEPTSRRRVLAILGGLGMLQALWMLVIPPFGGIDEFDHAYRAAAAARGQWLVEPSEATRGTGAWLEVPSDLVRAARPRCEGLAYTSASDCIGVRHGDVTRIASGAGRYHPLFYAVVGIPALPFDGAAALFVMRLSTAALALTLLALALAGTRRWARTAWPGVGLATVCTPVVVYSGSFVSPNGVEMMAALAFWCSAFGLMMRRSTRSGDRCLTVAATVSAAVLATLRPLGPLWCLLIVLSVVICVRPPWSRFQELMRDRAAQIGGAVVFLSALQCTVWVFTMHALKLGVEPGIRHSGLAHRIVLSLGEEPLWALQTIAAFPMRNQPTHTSVYATYLVLFLAVMVIGLKRASSHARTAIGVVVLIAVGLPFLSTVSSFDKFGVAWQGRYGLPLSMGIVLLATWALDRRGHPVDPRFRFVAMVLFVVAHAVSLAYSVHVAPGSPPAHLPAPWTALATIAIGCAALVAAATVWWGATAEPDGARA